MGNLRPLTPLLLWATVCFASVLLLPPLTLKVYFLIEQAYCASNDCSRRDLAWSLSLAFCGWFMYLAFALLAALHFTLKKYVWTAYGVAFVLGAWFLLPGGDHPLRTWLLLGLVGGALAAHRLLFLGACWLLSIRAHSSIKP